MLGRSPAGALLAVSSIVVGALAQSDSQWTASPFNPPAIPIAVKSPYLNTWLAQGGDPPAANEAWADFWDEVGHIAGTSTGDTELYAGVNVDGVPYRILGNAEIPNVRTAQQLAVDITATRTSFLFSAGPMDVNATFLSPIDLSDLTIMSRPTTYFYMTASSNDGKSHTVAMYSDISSQWVSSSVFNGTEVGAANGTAGDTLHLFTAMLGVERYTEVDQQSSTVMAFYSTPQVDGLSFEIGIDSDVRTTFATNSSLSIGGTIGGIQSNLLNQVESLPVLGLAVNLGSIKQTANPVIWALTLLQSSDIQFASADGIQQRYPYYLSQSSVVPNTTSSNEAVFEDKSDISFLDSVLSDFDSLLLNSIAIDNAVRADGLSISPEYPDILATSLRQVMASMEITISVGSDGHWNTSDVMSFMKNMGALGSSAGINCVDILYSAFPAFLYTNSSFGRYLLEPLFDFADRPSYPLLYAPQDIGTTYPNATGNLNAHLYGIEETANMIIMTYADILYSGDGSLAIRHYDLLKSWGSYLLNNSLIPGNQFAPESSENGSLVNVTNLALKGIIGVGAMGQISNFLGFSADGVDFQANAEALMTKWQQMAVVNDQVILSYNAPNSTGLLYNLYADKMLQLNLVPQAIYDAQIVSYGQQAPNSLYGIATTSAHSTTRADWMMLSAASLVDESPGVRDAMILQVHRYLSANTTNLVFPVEYDIATGNPVLAVNSPSAGAMFAVLAAAGKQINPSTSSSIQAMSSSHIKRWVVIFVSTFVSALALILVFLAFYFVRRRNQQQARRRRQIFVRLHDLPRAATPRTATQGQQLSPLPNFDADFKAPVDSEGLSDAFALKGYLEQQRAMQFEGANPPSYEGLDVKVDVSDVKTDAEHQ
ncbi:DUF1793-domain-containing protein [Schizopora paradoxa]|uniref:DUF1793-domain-containing protein n=1 Tax=Schizopora paradoxa TaxID=27342 RepID=A0A0H2SG99_9AGAM|nr:DUF1793-domain-containing protein [Schizopora paradoxa]